MYLAKQIVHNNNSQTKPKLLGHKKLEILIRSNHISHNGSIGV
jgi:hypothetical protein